MQLQMQQQALQAQQKVADAEMQKAQATMMNGQLKEQINAMKAEMEALKDAGQQRFNIQKLQTDAALKLTELEINAKRDLNRDVQDNKEALNGGSTKGSEERASSAS